MVMEFIDGPHLGDLLGLLKKKNRRATVRLAGGIILQALSALDHLHNLNDKAGTPLKLVHRDISPHNILLSKSGTVKLIDYGLVRGPLIEAGTQAGILKGKLAYVSPEQAQLRPLDARSDVFSLGLCFYELLAGQRPFLGPEMVSMMRLIEEEPPPIQTLAPEVPDPIAQVVHRALQKSPDARFRSARAFKNALWSAMLQTCGPVDPDALMGELTGIAHDRAPAPRVVTTAPLHQTAPFVEPVKDEVMEVITTQRAQERARSGMLLGFVLSALLGIALGVWLLADQLTSSRATSNVRIFSSVEQALQYADQALQAGRSAEALHALEQAAAQKPEHAQIQRRLGDARLAQGELERAVKHYRRYLELSPNAPDAKPLQKMLQQL